jgi:hypothetical protein
MMVHKEMVHKELVERVSNVVADAAGFYDWLHGDGESINVDRLYLWEGVIKDWMAQQLDAKQVRFAYGDLCVSWSEWSFSHPENNWMVSVWVPLPGWVLKIREAAGLADPMIDSSKVRKLKLNREQVIGILVQYK